MKLRWPSTWILGLVVTILSLAPVVAQPGGDPPGRGPHGGAWLVERMAEELDLTADQRAKVREITARHFGGALGNHRDAMRQARETLDKLVRDAAATDAQVQEAAASVSAQVALVALDEHHMVVEINGVLTAEQRQKAAEFRLQRRGRPFGPPPEAADPS